MVMTLHQPIPAESNKLPDPHLLRIFVEQSPSAMAMFDSEMRYMGFSRRWTEDFHLCPDDLHGRRHYEVFPEIPPRWREVHGRALKGEIVRALEDEFRRDDGTIHWLSWEVRPWRYPRGEIGGIVIFSEDITARKQAERALEAELSDSRRVQGLAAKLAGDNDLGSASQEILCTARALMKADAATLQEYDPDSQTMRLLAHAGLHPRSAELWRIMDASSGTPCGSVLRERRPVFCRNVGELADSAAFRLSGVMSVLSLPLAATGEKIIGILTLHWKQAQEEVREVSPVFMLLMQLTADFIVRVRTMEAMRWSEQRHLLVLQASRAGVWFWRPESNERVWDDAMLALFGLPPGRSPETLVDKIHPEDRQRFESQLNHILQPSDVEEWNIEFRVIRPDRRIVWLNAIGRAVRNSAGKVVEMSGIAIDITARKLQEQERSEARRLEAVGRLAGSIAHDINNLLAVVSGNLELALNGVKDEASARLIGRAAEAARLGGSFNRRLASFVRPSGLAAAPLDVNERAQEMGDLLKNVIGENLKLTTELSPGLWEVSADPGETDAAILNLVINSRDAMPGGGKILIGTSNVTLDESQASALRAGTRAGDYVRLSIADDGPGMPDAVLRQVLEPFYTTKPQGRGMGLGLPSVDSFARNAGGFIIIDSAPGKGCTVSIYLPRLRTADDERAPAAARNDVPLGDGELVLVVEDDPNVREVTLRRLENLGYAVEEARSGPEAVRHLQAGLPARAVLSDIAMPDGMNGFELARWIGTNLPGIGVVLCSGHALTSLDASSGESTFTGTVLAKPFTREELAFAMHEALSGKATTPPAPER